MPVSVDQRFVSESDAMHWRPKTKLVGDIQRSRRTVKKIEAHKNRRIASWRPQDRVILANASRSYLAALEAHLTTLSGRSANPGFRDALRKTIAQVTGQARSRLSNLIRTAPARMPESAIAELQSLDDFIVASFQVAARNVGISPKTADEYALHLKAQLLSPTLTTAQRALMATFLLLIAKGHDLKRSGNKDAMFEFAPMGVAA